MGISCRCRGKHLLYLYVDEDTFNVLWLEKPLKRLHKVLHRKRVWVLFLIFLCMSSLYLCACDVWWKIERDVEQVYKKWYHYLRKNVFFCKFVILISQKFRFLFFNVWALNLEILKHFCVKFKRSQKFIFSPRTQPAPPAPLCFLRWALSSSLWVVFLLVYECTDLLWSDCGCVHTCSIDCSVSEYFSSVCLISCRQHSLLSTPVFCC